MKQLICLFVIVVGLLPMTAVSETKADDWERVIKLKRGTNVSIQTMDGRILSGTIGDTWKNGITLFGDNIDIIHISRNAVLRIWKPRKRQIRLPILIGIGLGATTGYIIGKSAETDGDRQEDPGLVPIIGTCTGSLIGATVGLLIGFSENQSKDKIIYESN